MQRGGRDLEEGEAGKKAGGACAGRGVQDVAACAEGGDSY
jgi:hypothetical protein